MNQEVIEVAKKMQLIIEALKIEGKLSQPLSRPEERVCRSR